jgi:dipeptidyl-peptidase-4
MEVGMAKKIICLGTALIVIFCVSAFSAGPGQEKLSIQARFNQGLLAGLESPQYRWLNNGRIILLDPRVEESRRMIEYYDPDSGRRTPALDAAKVLSSLKACYDGNEFPSLRWPDALDRNGENAAYILGGDLFIVNFQSSAVRRLTTTPAAETSASFSPDGKWLAFIRENDLFVWNLETNNEKRLTSGASETRLNGPLSWVYWEELYRHTDVPYEWSPDSSAIAYLQTDDSPVSISTFVNFRPASQEAVRQRYPKAGQTNPRVRLGVVELSSAESTWIDCGQYEYISRFNWLRDGKEIAVQTQNRRQSELTLIFGDRRTGRSRVILVDKQPAWINLNSCLYFLNDGKRFVWCSERDGYQHLYLYDLEGKMLASLTKGEFMVIRSGGQFLEREYDGLAGVDEKHGFVYFISNQESLRERNLYRVRLDGRELKKISLGSGVHAIGFSPDMARYLDRYSNYSFPPEMTLHLADGKKLAVVSPSAKDSLESLNLSFPEFITSTAEDGLELPAMLMKPANFDPAKKYPAVVYIYGGPQYQQIVDVWETRSVVFHNVFTQAGYIVFIPEVRAGMGKSKAIETSVYEQAYGMQNVRDILAGVKKLKQLPFVDGSRLGIWGGSGGGCTTLYVMTHSDVFKAGISLYPVSDWHFYDTIYTERYLNTPQANPQGYKDTSSVLAAANLKGRLLLAHGTFDDNCHPQNTEAFIDALIKNNIQFDLMIYPWRKHGIGFFPDDAQLHLQTLMLDFWKRNL